MAVVEYFSQDVSFKIKAPRKTAQWLRSVVEKENKGLTHLNYIFCSDKFLLSLNDRYLNHKTLTDIITFDYSDEADKIEGDIFISVDRVRDNAQALDNTFEDELHRVMVHGVLHLSGYGDKSPEEKSRMRKKEDAYLSLRNKN